MFRILSLELVNWDYWQQFTLPLNAQIITIAGPNGSGKTTLLDSLRTLLALPCSGQRDYKRYLRHSGQAFAWLRAVVENKPRDGKWIKPFHPHQQERVTLLCRFTSKGGEWKREYLIEDGEVQIGPALDASKHWLGLEQYKRRLAEAGLSSAVAKVLALEQGETDKLCEYSAKDLLNLVFTVFGDKEPLDNYQKARDEQRGAERELEDQKRELARLELELETLKGKAEKHLEWKRLKAQRETLALQAIPCLRWLADGEAAQAAEREANTLAEQHREAVKAASEAQQAHERLQAQQVDLDAENTQLEAAHEGIRKAHERARDAANGFDKLLKEQARLQQLAAEAGNGDAAVLQAAFNTAQQDRDALIERRGLLREQKKNLAEQVAQLESSQGRPAPADTLRLRAALHAAQIEHSLLVELVQVKDESWRGAVEALLKPYPHLVVLHREADTAAAWEIGERLGYRQFITADRATAPRAKPGSVLEVTHFTAPPPAWLPQTLDRVQRVEDVAEGRKLGREQDWITRSGYYRERRGARDISVAARDQLFGEGAQRASLAALRSDLAAVERALENGAQAVMEAEATLNQARAALSGITAAATLAQRASEFAEAAAQWPGADGQAQAALQAFTEHLDRVKRISKELGSVQAKVGIALHTAQKSMGDAHLAEAKASAAETRSRELANKLRETAEKLSPAWREAAALDALKAEWETLTKAEAKLSLIEDQLEKGHWEQDELIEGKRDNYAKNFKAQQDRAALRESHLSKLAQLTEDARAAYLGVLRRSVTAYGSNIKRLGELAGIEVKHEMPQLENDDVTLSQAGLNVRFNFDGKGLMGLNDGEASGGQQVMKSLILLMGLMMDEREMQRGEGGSGFVFIDEPFAHLDIVNIDRVGTFLRATRAQYLITTPLTHNTNVYQPTDVMLCTFKKKPGDRHAPPVALARRAVRATEWENAATSSSANP